MIYIITILILLFGISEGYQYYLSMNIGQYQYETIKKIEGIEIRKYKASYFSSTQTSAKNYESGSRNGFRVLAGYIFGGNKENKKIAMTSPVVMDMKQNLKMSFLIPYNIDPETLPSPNSDAISIEYVPERTMAIIQFGGFANDDRIKAYAEELRAVLKKHNIKHQNHYSYFGYNPPYQVLGRTNEIAIQIY